MKPRPYGDYALRALTCGLLFVAGFALLSTSAFALHMRDDAPGFVPGLTGAQSIALAVALALSVIPLLAGRRFFGALVACGWLMAGIGAYWWTLIPWDEYVTDSDFPASRAPGVMDYALVMTPAILAAFYAVASRYSRMRADYLARGAERDEASRAAAASFLAGGAALVLSAVLAGAFAWLLETGALQGGLPQVTGVPAVVLAGIVALAGYLLGSRRLKVRPVHVPAPAEREDAPAPRSAKGRARRVAS